MAGKRALFQGVINRIRLVGIELEGGWDKGVPKALVPAGIIRDGSVEFRPPDRYDDVTRMRMPEYAIGEAVSLPMQAEQAESFIRTCYPQHVNQTCGLHVHMSFYHRLNYSRLMTPEYMQFLIEELRRFGTQRAIPDDSMFWARLDPDNAWTRRHCAHVYLGDRQVAIDHKDYHSRGKEWSRYTFINYCDMQHNTVEVRGLPMFGTTGAVTTKADVDLAIDAVHCVITSTNRFLSRIRHREKKTNCFVEESYPVVQEIGHFVR